MAPGRFTLVFRPLFNSTDEHQLNLCNFVMRLKYMLGFSIKDFFFLLLNFKTSGWKRQFYSSNRIMFIMGGCGSTAVKALACHSEGCGFEFRHVVSCISTYLHFYLPYLSRSIWALLMMWISSKWIPSNAVCRKTALISTNRKNCSFNPLTAIIIDDAKVGRSRILINWNLIQLN